MKETKKKTEQRVIRAALKTDDVTKVKVTFSKEPWTPEEFTSVFMAILETYTEGLLTNNTREAIFTHFNNVFGIYLQKLVPEKKHYEMSEAHKAFKEHTDKTLNVKETLALKTENEENRLAAYILARDILVTEMGLTEESADLLLNRRLGLLKTPQKGGEKNEKDKEKGNTKE